MRVLLQAGHSSLYPPYAPRGGGAPGEAEWTADLAERLAARLQAARVETVIVGHWYGYAAPPETRERFDLFGSLHYDSTEPGRARNSWCFADRGANDPMAAESDRAVALWQARYPAATGIALREDRRNPNTSYYYAFIATTSRTPGMLLEHGCGSPVPVGDYPAGDDATFLREQIDLVAALDAEAILAFLGAGETPPEPTPQEDPPMASDNDRALLELAHALDTANAVKAQFEGRLSELEGHVYRREARTNRLGRRYWVYVPALPRGSVAALIAAGRGG